MELQTPTAMIALGFLLLLPFASMPGVIAGPQTPSVGQGASTDGPAEDLVIVGTVTRIYPAPSRFSTRNWAVITQVERVISGQFSKATFTFMVHSPSRIGLEAGRTYTIKAKRRGGVQVDETKRFKPMVTNL